MSRFHLPGCACEYRARNRPTKGGWPGEEARWTELLNAKDERLRFDVLKVSYGSPRWQTGLRGLR